jgi:uncharacterized protein DUF6984
MLLITQILRGTTFELRVVHDLADVLVEDMADGGMGSVRFHSAMRGTRRFGQQIAEASFVDEDGVPVSATLNLDQNGDLFELDLWKADNSALRRYPAQEAINVVTSDR